MAQIYTNTYGRIKSIVFLINFMKNGVILVQWYYMYMYCNTSVSKLCLIWFLALKKCFLLLWHFSIIRCFCWWPWVQILAGVISKPLKWCKNFRLTGLYNWYSGKIWYQVTCLMCVDIQNILLEESYTNIHRSLDMYL